MISVGTDLLHYVVNQVQMKEYKHLPQFRFDLTIVKALKGSVSVPRGKFDEKLYTPWEAFIKIYGCFSNDKNETHFVAFLAILNHGKLQTSLTQNRVDGFVVNQCQQVDFNRDKN